MTDDAGPSDPRGPRASRRVSAGADAPERPGARCEVFLSYSRDDADSVHRIAVRLKQAGVEPWFDRWTLTPGGDWQREVTAGIAACPACAVFVGRGAMGPWERMEVALALDRAAGDDAYRLFPVLLPGPEPFDPDTLPGFLRTRTWVDFRRGVDSDDALRDLIHAVEGRPFGPDVPIEPRTDVCPYVGLRTFEEQDAGFYFGRDADVQRILEKLKATRILGVLGPSGSGKSSLVRAGVVAALQADPASRDWPVRVMRPGARPITALAAELVALAGEPGMQATVAGLLEDPATLDLATALALGSRTANRRVLVVVDQLEEVFTLCRDERERDALFANLLHASTAPGGRTIVIVTLRADFYPALAAFRELAQALASHHVLVAPMDADALRQAIEQPALKVGLRFEAGLVDEILSDVGVQPGVLPLLSHALLETWRNRRGPLLTRAGYERGGGVSGAIARRAEQVYEEITASQREIARRVLLRLTQPGDGTEDTRRRASLSELRQPPEDQDAVGHVLDRLVDARLVTVGDTWAEVSHEALIRGWPRLRAWIDEDREWQIVHRRITESAQQWADEDRTRTLVYRGSQLDRALEGRKAHPGDLNPLELRFLAAGTRRRLRARLAGATAVVLAAAALNWALVPLVRDYLWKRDALALSPTVAFAAGPAILGGGGEYGHRTRRRLTVAAFEIDLHEVTNEQYGLCVKAERCTAPIESGGVARSAGPRTPVVSVNALQAWDFCAWLGRRLPSDAEWERAARGPDGDLWPRGTRPPARAVNVNRARPVAVDDPRFRAGRTEEGLTHMAGNASEWTATPDRCAPDPYACRRVWDGSRRATLIIRGRGFEEAADRLDGSDADISGSGEEWAYVGFRCARTR